MPASAPGRINPTGSTFPFHAELRTARQEPIRHHLDHEYAEHRDYSGCPDVWNFELPAEPQSFPLDTLAPRCWHTITTLTKALMRNKVMAGTMCRHTASDITDFGLNRSGWTVTIYWDKCNGSYSIYLRPAKSTCGC